MPVAKTHKAKKANGKSAPVPAAKPAKLAANQKENEAQIAVHWKEEEYFHPSPKFIGQANLNDPAIVERFAEKYFPECFREYAELLHWDQYWRSEERRVGKECRS